jgi:hypothetical protein
MEAADRLEEAKADVANAVTLAEREDAREEINHWRRVLFLAGTEEDQ